MAARKLAAEIDKTLKKISEGILEFEGIHEKLQSASTPSQSAKYESELKTSIKRLQRHRDMLKTWLQNNDIKDKSALLENRKLIEVQMERFKASEKELKTKAFSKEGLIAASRLDPAEKAKVELSQWISGMVDELARQVETTEAEIEQLAGGTKKKKGGASSERTAQLDQLNDRRKWHSSRLEILLRMLENGTLETDRVSDIKEDISYFVESNADEDFEEDEGIYDEFNLDEEEEAFGLKDTDDINSHDAVSIPEDAPTPSKSTAKEAAKGRRESEDTKGDDKAAAKKGSSAAGLASSTAQRKTSTSETPTKESKAIPPVNFSQAKAAPAHSPSSTTQVTSPPKAPAAASLPPIRYAAAAAAAVSPGQTASTAPPAAANNASTPSPIAAGETLPSEGAAARTAPSPPVTSSSRGETNGTTSSPAPSNAQSLSMQFSSVTSTPAIEHAKTSQNQQGLHADDSFSQAGGAPVSPLTNVSASGPPGLQSNGAAASSPHRANELRLGSVNISQSSPSVSSAIAAPGRGAQGGASGGVGQANHDGNNADESAASFQPAQLAASSAAAGVVQPAGGGAGTTSQQAAAQRQQGTEARLPSSLADLVSSFESAKQNSMRRDNDLRQVHSSLESSFMNVPEPQDSDKPKYYVPQNPYPTPHWYPQSTSSLFDNAAIYAKFDEDTLFYIFYYSQRDYHRYLAARELKRQSWRFSIRYGTWFRRHSEPIVINEEYEEGSYVYFDFESSWCQRRKNHFRFEYKYLESEL